jgi:hypothetical protein
MAGRLLVIRTILQSANAVHRVLSYKQTVHLNECAIMPFAGALPPPRLLLFISLL